jgi:hypothetical protein
MRANLIPPELKLLPLCNQIVDETDLYIVSLASRALR